MNKKQKQNRELVNCFINFTERLTLLLFSGANFIFYSCLLYQLILDGEVLNLISLMLLGNFLMLVHFSYRYMKFFEVKK